MKVDARMLARPARVHEQPVDAAAPVTTAVLDLALEPFDLVAGARLVSDARGEAGRRGRDVSGSRYAAGLQEERPKPVAPVERETRQDASPSLVIDALGPLDRFVQTPDPPQRAGAREQRGQVYLLVESTSRRRPIVGDTDQRFGVVLLECRLIFEPQRLEICRTRTVVLVEETHCSRGRFVRKSASELLTAEPEIQGRLFDVELQRQDGVTGGVRAGAVQIRTGLADVVESESRLRSLEQGTHSVGWIGPTVGEQDIAIEGNVMPAEG
ncbi:MAG TPA: hypothetical protein VE269_08135 [Gaiellaceae bacterium]|nr:hypothetical protein [Gaiellaceae bacterium]